MFVNNRLVLKGNSINSSHLISPTSGRLTSSISSPLTSMWMLSIGSEVIWEVGALEEVVWANVTIYLPEILFILII